MREPGIYSDLDIDMYHASEGISSSGINLILDCPARYYYEYHIKPKQIDPKEARKQSDKFKIGRAVHMLVLEPNRFNDTFYCMTESINLVSKAGKEMYAKAEEAANGREILRAGDWEEIKAMADAARLHSIWNELKGGLVEQSIFWDGILNVRLRARPDIFTDDRIVDLKTTDNINGFAKSIYSYGYHRQAAMQIDGLKSIDTKERDFGFFVVEKKPPYLTAYLTLSEESLHQGRKEYEEGALTYQTCLLFDEWPGYDKKLHEISLPKWSIKGDENE